MQHRVGFRFTLFALIGAGVFIAGLALQVLLVRYAGLRPDPAYAAQAVFSIELSYLLNRYLTWRDRSVGWWVAAWRFNAQKLLMTVVNLAGYALLVRAGMEYVVANLVLTAIFTPVNYFAADLLVFVHGGRRDPAPAEILVRPRRPEVLPTVSVVIPCKSSERTIRATVDSLLAQDYPALAEVILVGDVGDSTWTALTDVDDPRLVLLEQEKTPGRRDPNVKRDKGIRKARGDVLALADSDIVVDPGWLGRAVALLTGQGGGLVAGGMQSIHDTFWGRFVDHNVLAAKTPRLPKPYQVTAQNFGARGRKPPVTANAVFTRSLYESCPLDVTWAYGYEDYEWFWRLVKDGHSILFSGDLVAAHHHRRCFSQLVREYRQSAHGCAQFIRAHPDSPLARKRTAQAFGLPAGALGVLGLGAFALAEGYAMLVGGLLVIAAILVTGREVSHARRLEAISYPPAALALGGIYAVSIAGNLLRPAGRPGEAPTWGGARGTAPVHAGPAAGAGRLLADRRRGRYAAAFGLVLAVGAAIRFWSLSSRPGWQYDEAVYTDVATNVLAHGTVNEHITLGAAWSPDLYEPPFYAMTLARWFAVTGASIYHARIFGVICALLALTLLWRLFVRMHGDRIALFATVPIVLDGWLMYVQRISYMENALLLLVIAGVLLYQRALATPTWWRFIAAGVVLGAAAGFKYTGVYVVVTVLVCWLLVRHSHRKHLALLGCALAAFGAMIAFEVLAFDSNGHDWWLQDTLVQLRRVLGVQHSGGTLTSPTAALHLLFAQYDVFAPSFLIALLTLVLALRRLWTCYRRRQWQEVTDHALLWSWMASALVVFGLSSLRYPQYFALILVPMYAWFWTEASRWRLSPRSRAALLAVACLAGIASFGGRIVSYDDNVFANVQQYAAGFIPPNAVVLADESIGDLIGQPYCREQTATCANVASYAISWDTYLQSTWNLGDPAYRKTVTGAVRLRSWTGFNGSVTVWKIRRPARLSKGVRPRPATLTYSNQYDTLCNETRAITRSRALRCLDLHDIQAAVHRSISTQ